MKKTLMCATAVTALAGSSLVAQAEDGWYGRADIGIVGESSAHSITMLKPVFHSHWAVIQK